MLGFVPHTLQSLSFLIFTFLISELKVSKISKWLFKLWPIPIISYKISIPWIEPILPASAPNTPASPQEAIKPFGGGSGHKHL